MNDPNVPKRTCMCRKLKIPQTKPTNPKIAEICQELILDNCKLKMITRLLLDNINRGLGKATHPDSIVKCFPTYVQDIPDGSETGKFLALDLGGTNFRVLLIILTPNHFEMKSKVFSVPPHIMTGTGDQLFDHIAECLYKFMKSEDMLDEVLPLGFTFSFPLIQTGLTIGVLERWTKGFSCDDVVGADVVDMLREAVKRRGDIQIEVYAILNDTTGTLMSCAWKAPHCKIGLIIGTGNNACYLEKQSLAELFDEEDLGSGKVIINLEMGAFGDDGCLDFVKTEYDRDVDENSINAGKQSLEKMVSGMYMGEIVRQVIVKLTKLNLIFCGKLPEALEARGSFETKFVSEIESDPMGCYDKCRDTFGELGTCDLSDQDCINIRFVCECVSRRAAHLISAAMVTLLNKVNEPRVTVGIDGSLYRFHPHFHNLMMEKMTQLVKPGIIFDLMLSDDGSGRGAALVAAVAQRQMRAKNGTETN